jgi:two-component system nitrate/nitrite response regulator NarL
MSLQRSIRVCIVEDHAIVRNGMRMLLLSHEVEIVGEASDRRTAFAIAEITQPDLFLLDLQLGQESAADFLEELLSLGKANAILFTGIANEQEIQRAIQAGAMGLVYKHENPEMLIRAIYKVQAGESWLPRSLMTTALSQLRKTHSRKEQANPEAAKIASLTPREREIVALVASGINRKGIAERLFVSDATVRNHLTSIFGKLDVGNQFELVFYAQRNGLDNNSPQLNTAG